LLSVNLAFHGSDQLRWTQTPTTQVNKVLKRENYQYRRVDHCTFLLVATPGLRFTRLPDFKYLLHYWEMRPPL